MITALSCYKNHLRHSPSIPEVSNQCCRRILKYIGSFFKFSRGSFHTLNFQKYSHFHSFKIISMLCLGKSWNYFLIQHFLSNLLYKSFILSIISSLLWDSNLLFTHWLAKLPSKDLDRFSAVHKNTALSLNSRSGLRTFGMAKDFIRRSH